MEQTQQGLAHSLTKFSFYPESNGKPLEGFK